MIRLRTVAIAKEGRPRGHRVIHCRHGVVPVKPTQVQSVTCFRARAGSNCLIERVAEQLHCLHPNTGLMCTFLNSMARSLRAQLEARAACLTIEPAIEVAGMLSTWQSGI